MSFGLCNLPVIPLRAEPSHRSEMSSQLLFGDSFEILETRSSWIFVRLEYDHYEGWIDAKEYVEISPDLFNSLANEEQPVTGLSSHSVCLKVGLEEMINLLPGSTLPQLVTETSFSINEQDYLYLGESSIPNPDDFANLLEETAQFYLNSPYLWGGRSLFGIDCSGFSQIVYKHLGVKIRRDAKQQAEQGRTIDILQEAKPGDLAFFDNAEGKITHVGIILEDSEIIHASGRVKVDQLDEKGIFCKDTQKYTHKLKTIKRIVE